MAAYPIAALNNVLRMVNGNPATPIAELLPYEVPSSNSKSSSFPIASSTAKAFVDSYKAGKLPDWMLADLAKYYLEWSKIC